MMQENSSFSHFCRSTFFSKIFVIKARKQIKNAFLYLKLRKKRGIDNFNKNLLSNNFVIELLLNLFIILFKYKKSRGDLLHGFFGFLQFKINFIYKTDIYYQQYRLLFLLLQSIEKRAMIFSDLAK